MDVDECDGAAAYTTRPFAALRAPLRSSSGRRRLQLSTATRLLLAWASRSSRLWQLIWLCSLPWNDVHGWDSKRTSLFAFFGLAYQGCAQYFIINTLLEGLFPGRTARCVLAKIASVTMVADPFLFLPVFYIFKESIARERVDVDTISHALHKQRENFVADVRNSLMLWIPGHCVTYGVLTPPLRLPWIACVSFVYVTILSFTRGSIPERGSARADGKTTPNSPQLRRLNSVGLPAVEDAHNDISTSQGDRTSATPPYCSHHST